jgi:hypothetical protein
MSMVLAAASAMLLLAASASGTAPGEPISCASIARESATIGAQLESTMGALGTSMARHASEALAANKARNAVSSTAGFLNWAAPGAGTAIDLASQAATNAATRAREGKMARERVTTTTSVEAAARRLAELDRLSQELNCFGGH